MTFSEAINVQGVNIDITTGGQLTHEEVYGRAIDLLGGLDAVIPFIPYPLDKIQEALKDDEHLNNLPMRLWDAKSGFVCHRMDCTFLGGGIWHLYRKVGITSASCAEGVCLLKEAARRWAKRGY